MGNSSKNTTHIVSIDCGNGFTTGFATRFTKGKSSRLNHVAFPSVRAVSSGASVNLGDELSERLIMQYDWVEWGKHKYLVGDDVFISRRSIERHRSDVRYGDEHWYFLVAVALGRLVPKGGKINLTVFVPPALYTEASKRIRERFATHDYGIAIRFKDTTLLTYHIEQLHILPEGLGGMCACVFDKTGAMVGQDFLVGRTVILDLGMFTTDAIEVTNGQLNPENLETSSWKDEGIYSHILKPIRAIVASKSKDFSILSEDNIDLVIRKGLETGDYTLISGTSQLDIKPLVDTYAEKFATWIANTVIDGEHSALRGSRAILLGGGSVLVKPYLMKWYSDQFVDLQQHKHLKGLAELDFNAIGGLRMALATQATVAQAK